MSAPRLGHLADPGPTAAAGSATIHPTTPTDKDAPVAHASPRHVPAKILQVADIPRTLNGKIAELAVRNVIHNRPVRNRDALANPEALELFQDLAELRI